MIGALLAFVWCVPLLHCLRPRVTFCCCARSMLKACWPVDTGKVTAFLIPKAFSWAQEDASA